MVLALTTSSKDLAVKMALLNQVGSEYRSKLAAHSKSSLSIAQYGVLVNNKAAHPAMKDSIRVLVCLQALGSVAFAYSFSFILLEITVSPPLARVHCLLCVRCIRMAVRR